VTGTLTSDLAANIRSGERPGQRSRHLLPNVWEFWPEEREVYDAVDFVTIHILPYWEDMPVKAKFAAGHVDSIRKRMAVRFRQGDPDRRDRLAECGTDAEGALPSRTNQARIVSEILDLAKMRGLSRQSDRGL